jgi:NADPH2:quinone reductase
VEALGNLRSGRGNGLSEFGGQDPASRVLLGCSPLDEAKRPDERGGNTLAGHREVLQSTLGLGAPERVGGDRDLAHGVPLDTNRVVHVILPRTRIASSLADMRAVIADHGTVHVATVADPAPQRHEALVEVHAAGINAADLLQARGHYPPPPGYDPSRLGLEFVGVVRALGDGVTEVSVGQAVMGITGGGAQAELVVVDAATLVPVPEDVDLVTAGGVPEAAFTALDALLVQGSLRLGDRVLVSGALGGVGSVALQIARLAGGRVTAVVRDPARAADAYGLGAHRVLTPEEVPGSGPYDVVLELVGSPRAGLALGELATGGRIVVIGVGAGTALEVDLRRIMARRGVLRGSTLRARPVHEKAALAAEVAHRLGPALAEGTLRVPIQGTWPLERAAEAYAAFRRPGKLGKLVLTLR